jgi:signal peptidase I
MELKLFILGITFFVIAMFMLFVRKYFKNLFFYKIFKTFYSAIDCLWTSILVASFVMFFIVQAFKIPSGSMEKTLKIGDYLFVNKFIYGIKIPFVNTGKRYIALRNVKRGDIVVFKCPINKSGFKKTDHYVKRCIAVGGDKVEIRNKKLYINDLYVEESYVYYNDSIINNKSFYISDFKYYQKFWESGKFISIPLDYVLYNFGPVIIPKNHYMMLGDNRNVSFDSRFWGPLHDKYIEGKAFLIYWPIKNIRII